MTPRDKAVQLARQGYRVFRVDPQTHKPTRSGWTERASNNPDVVETDFTDALGESVEDNPAIATGGDLLVVDVDVKGGKPGLLSLAELAAEGLPLDTRTVRTPSGGLHLYYRVDPSKEYRNRVGWREGVDVRGFNGFVFAPGAVKAAGEYAVERDLPTVDLPDSFYEDLARPKLDHHALTTVESKYEDEWSLDQAVRVLAAVEPIEGEKHKRLIAAVHKCFDLGVTPARLMEMIPEHVEWFAALYTQDLDREIESVVKGRVRDGKEWGIEHPSRRAPLGDVFEPIEGVKVEPDGLETFSVAEFAGTEPPARQWLASELIPDLAVTTLSGDGGVGKSLLSLQLGAAVATGREWLGIPVKRGPVLYVSAEDDRDEIHRRLSDITRAEGIGFEELGDFHVAVRAGLDAVMGAPNAQGLVKPTALWRALERRVAQLKPSLVQLDTLSDVFGGDENVRAAARQFIGLLRGLAIEHQTCVLLLAHPSLSGMASERGTSGSTGWHNSVRGLLYLTRPSEKDGALADDPKARVLQIKKANYADASASIPLRWTEGRFMRLEARVVAEADSDGVFLALLERFTAQGREVSPEPRANGYAPKFFAEQPEAKAEGLDEKAMKTAMERLFTSGEIVAERYGPPSKKWRRIVRGGR